MNSACDRRAITAAILAGGAGTRLGGRDKGLELLGGKPLICRVIDAVRGQADTVLICANRNAGRYAEFAAVCSDELPGFRGPLAGIAAALSRCATSWLLTVPVDCPNLPHDLALRLCAGLGDRRAAVASDGRARQPLFALYGRELAASAAAALAQDMSVWRWQEEIGAAVVDFADTGGAFTNLNTPDDFRQWDEVHGG